MSLHPWVIRATAPLKKKEGLLSSRIMVGNGLSPPEAGCAIPYNVAPQLNMEERGRMTHGC